jgi:flagellar hook-associated protein 2
MANASIGGLVSGLDTASIVSQLMQLESQSQSRLKVRVSTEQTASNALQALNAKLSTLAAKAGELAKVTGWGASNATSSSEQVSVTTVAGVTPASLELMVVRTATRTQAVFANDFTRTAQATTAATLDLELADGTVLNVDTGSGSLADIASGVNAATLPDGSDAGLSAVLVRAGTANGEATYRLMITSDRTGADAAFSVLGSTELGAAVVTPGSDAALNVNGAEVTSATNTFEDLMPGVDVTLKTEAPAGAITITVGRDATALSDKVKGIVDALNAALTDISSVTAAGVNGAKAGVLVGNATLRQVRDELLSSVTGGVGGASLAELGIQSDRYGKIEFDEDAFAAAYAADPAKVEAMFVDTDPAAPAATNTDFGFATALEALGKRFSNSTDGVVTSLVKGRQSSIDGLNDAIDAWDSRLELRRSSLEKQYAALEVALGKLQSQGNWLAGQLNSLPQMSSGS